MFFKINLETVKTYFNNFSGGFRIL